MATTHTPRDTTRGSTTGRKHPLQLAAATVGAVFLLVGILGFVPGITTNFDDMQFAGHESESKLLGIFAVNVLHNLVHLTFGVLGLLAARSWMWAKNFLIYGGAIYLVLWLYGVVIDLDSEANFVNINTADNWLHLALGLGMLTLGFALMRPRD